MRKGRASVTGFRRAVGRGFGASHQRAAGVEMQGRNEMYFPGV
jgi:hypothetical protein